MSDTPAPRARPARTPRGLRATLAASLRIRLVLGFLLLALGLSITFVSAGRFAFGVGWREAARPLVADYVDRLAAEVAPGGVPDLVRAQALAARLPITLRIEGPALGWSSHPARADGDREHDRERAGDPDREMAALRTRVTADGHRLVFGLDTALLERRPGVFVAALGVLLVLTLLAYLYVRRQLRPLDAIRTGAQRFGAGEFDRPIPVADTGRPDELGQVARTLNTMGQDIRGMLDAKRGLLLAISHELRSPLTRARLHAELLPETPRTAPQRDALLHDLGEMGRLIADLLESERLAQPHAALHREPVDLAALVRAVLSELGVSDDGAGPSRDGAGAQSRRAVSLCVEDMPAPIPLDPSRIRLLLRNLLDNAWRHGGHAALPPQLTVRSGRDGPTAMPAESAAQVESAAGVWIEVRDHGPGVPEDQLDALAEPFYRPDSARTRAAGGVGLGLSLCRLVAQAHGGRMEIVNALPGLRVRVWLPRESSRARS